jgi:hypothetical protein
MRNLLIYFGFFVFTAGCHSASNRPLNNQLTGLVAAPRLTWLTPPPKVVRLPSLDSITQVWPSFIGLFPLAPRLVVEQADSLGERDFLSGFEYRALELADSLSTDGLELLVNYPQDLPTIGEGDSLAHPTYPVYVTNSTPHTKLLYGFSSGVYAIQEARDRTGRWRPIERNGRQWCGNGEWALKVRPHRVGVFVMTKYAGDFHTLLRIRWQNGASRYVSAPYAGSINERQFLTPKQDYAQLAYDGTAVNSLYNGAVPAAVDSIRQRRWRKEASALTP